MKNKYKTLCVVNPASANGRTRKSWASLEAYLRQAGLDFSVEYTQEPKEATQITRQALNSDYSRIVAVGGDGTLNEVLNGFYNSRGEKIKADSFLSFIPMGTGGDFARMFSMSSEPQNVYKALVDGEVKVIDIVSCTFTNWDGQVESRYFINVADIGLGSHTVHRVNRNSKALGGFLSFLLAGVYTLFTYKNQLVLVKIDDKKVYEGRTSLIAVGNGSYFGGGMKIAPHANLDDGLLDVIIVHDLTKIRLLQNLPRIYGGKHLQDPAIDFLTGKKVEIISPEELLLEFDGEAPGKGDIKIEIIPQELNLLL